MNRDDIIRMAREASGVEFPAPMDGVKIGMGIEHLERFANLVAAAEREKVAHWMMTACYATGHGDTTEDLLRELAWQADERIAKAVAAEREACAKIVEAGTGQPIQMRTLEILRQERERIAFVIRERGAPALERMNKAAEDNGEPL